MSESQKYGTCLFKLDWLTSWPACPWDLLVLTFSLPQSWDTAMWSSPGFYVGNEDGNSGPHTCVLYQRSHLPSRVRWSNDIEKHLPALWMIDWKQGIVEMWRPEEAGSVVQEKTQNVWMSWGWQRQRTKARNGRWAGKDPGGFGFRGRRGVRGAFEKGLAQTTFKNPLHIGDNNTRQVLINVPFFYSKGEEKTIFNLKGYC